MKTKPKAPRARVYWAHPSQHDGWPRLVALKHSDGTCYRVAVLPCPTPQQARRIVKAAPFLALAEEEQVEMLAKAIDGFAFIRYKDGDVLPRGAEFSTAAKENEIQGFRQQKAESQARAVLAAVYGEGKP